MRIHLSDLFLGTAITIAAGASLLFQGDELEREVAGQWERERGVADWASLLVGEAIGAPQWPRFSTPSILSQGEDQVWTVVGNLDLETESGEIQQQTYRALVHKICDDIEARKCWQLDELELDGDILVSAETRAAVVAASQAPASVPERVSDESAPAMTESLAKEPSADEAVPEQTAEAEPTAAEPLVPEASVPEPSVSETLSAATAVTEVSDVGTRDLEASPPEEMAAEELSPAESEPQAPDSQSPAPTESSAVPAAKIAQVTTVPPMETAPADEAAAEDVVADEIAADEVAPDDVTPDDVGPDKVGPDDVGLDDVGLDDVAVDEVAADAAIADEVASLPEASEPDASEPDASETAEDIPPAPEADSAEDQQPEPAALPDEEPRDELADLSDYADLPDEATVLPVAPEPIAEQIAAADDDAVDEASNLEDVNTDGPNETTAGARVTSDAPAPTIPESGTAPAGEPADASVERPEAGDVTLAELTDAIEGEGRAGPDNTATTSETAAPASAEEPLYTWVDPRVLFPIQRSLKSMGFEIGVVDGVLGPRTRDAIRQYQTDRGLAVDGEATEALLRHMEGASQTAATDQQEVSEPATESTASTTETTASLATTAEDNEREDGPNPVEEQGEAPQTEADEALYTWADPSLLLPIQRHLSTLGFQIGRPDGILGPRTRDAIRRYQADNGLTVDGTASEALKRHLEQRLDIQSAAADSNAQTPAAGTESTGVTSPVTPEAETSEDAPVETPSILVQQIQERLRRLGYNIGPADGLLGPKTREAISTFQWQKELAIDGEPSYQLLIQLDRALEG